MTNTCGSPIVVTVNIDDALIFPNVKVGVDEYVDLLLNTNGLNLLAGESLYASSDSYEHYFNTFISFNGYTETAALVRK